jgi:hypothetical protein
MAAVVAVLPVDFCGEASGRPLGDSGLALLAAEWVAAASPTTESDVRSVFSAAEEETAAAPPRSFAGFVSSRKPAMPIPATAKAMLPATAVWRSAM